MLSFHRQGVARYTCNAIKVSEDTKSTYIAYFLKVISEKGYTYHTYIPLKGNPSPPQQA